MRLSRTLLILAALLPPPASAAGCAPLRFGYTDQAIPPYYLGNGASAPEPPGALAELTRDGAAAAGCTAVMVRMPPARLRFSLNAGTIDATSLFSPDVVGASPNIVYPLDQRGKPDISRGLPLYTVLFVRSSDHRPLDGDPVKLMRGKVLGLSHGAPHIKYLQQMGVRVDDGAANPDLNFEKLKRGRIDGFAISLFTPGDMDEQVAARFGKQIVRLRKPMIVTHSWLALNKAYYDNNREHAEALWRWYGSSGQARFSALLKKYRE